MFNFNENKKLKAELQKLEEEYTEVKRREVEEKNELLRLKEVEREHQFVEALLKRYEIIGIEYNKDNVKHYVCVITYGNSIDISLRGMDTGRSFPRVYAKIHKFEDNDGTEITRCEIIDIFAKQERVGHGSILLRHLISYAKRQGVWDMDGWLSSEDKEDFDGLEKFYKENGFTVKFNEKRTSGSIKLEL